MAKLAVFGGTFDPIHNGHLVAAREVVKKLHVDRVLFVPTGDSYQKAETSSASHRAEMVRLAISSEPEFDLDTVDIDRPGATYTVDTLREIKLKHPQDELFFILGADALAGIESWKSYQSLFSLARFVVVTRPGHIFDSKFDHLVTRLDIPALDLSSTEIRHRKAEGKSIADLVPAEVANYIETNKLYEVNA